MGICFSKHIKTETPFHTDEGEISSDSINQIEGDILQSPNLKSFTFSELKAATRNSLPDIIIGGGGGSFSKGWVDENSFAASTPGNGMVVAVKRVKKEFGEGPKEWLSEITYRGQLRHPNLVKLIGYCSEDEHRFLVYEFMPNGSMENHLFRKSSLFQPLSWGQRMKVALGAARGLAYLHTAEKETIYHNFRTSNILLDSNYNGKLSYFRLARNGMTDDMDLVPTTVRVSTLVIGIHGYDAPEYLSTGHLTTKSDVYVFGVVLVEILTGKKAIDKNRSTEEHNLIHWAKPYLADKERISHVLDPHLEGQYSLNRALKAARVALRCLRTDPKLRPTMDEVVIVLEKLQDSNEAIRNSKNS